MNVDAVVQELWAERRDDVAQLGPAPRELDECLERYVRRAVWSLAPAWAILAILCGVGDGIELAAGAHHVPTLTLAFVALAVWRFRVRTVGRRRVRDVLREGALQRAMVTSIRSFARRGKFGRVLYTNYYVTFRLANDTEVLLLTRDGGISLAQIGAREEVLWTPLHGDLVVPTCLLL